MHSIQQNNQNQTKSDTSTNNTIKENPQSANEIYFYIQNNEKKYIKKMNISLIQNQKQDLMPQENRQQVLQIKEKTKAKGLFQQKKKKRQTKVLNKFAVLLCIIGTSLMLNTSQEIILAHFSTYNDTLVHYQLQRLYQLTLQNHRQTTTRQVFRQNHMLENIFSPYINIFAPRSINFTIHTSIVLGFKNLSSKNLYLDYETHQIKYNDQISVLHIEVKTEKNYKETFFDYWHPTEVDAIQRQIIQQYKKNQPIKILAKFKTTNALNSLNQCKIYQKLSFLQDFRMIKQKQSTTIFSQIQTYLNKFIKKFRKIYISQQIMNNE